MRFYLGTHMPSWLGRLDVPLFVSRRRLTAKRLPVASAPWALDSGGFTELSMFGEWRTTPAGYVDAVRRYRDEVGLLEWAAPQDWMCEPAVRAKTGLTVAAHQSLTIDNLVELRMLAPDLPIVPVLQGWEADDYLRHVDAYAARGIDLEAEALVGLGTVCRRQATDEIEGIVWRLAAGGLRLHGFGVKTKGLARFGHLLASADSLAWSFAARYEPREEGCTSHKTCANCPRFALSWRGRTLAAMDAAGPMTLVAATS